MWFGQRRWRAGAAVAVTLVAGVACNRAPRELLFIYSGDCQGYVEPCG